MKPLTLLLLLALAGCDNWEKEMKEIYPLDGYRIVVIDSCEYLQRGSSGQAWNVLTHKGNCRYCLERNRIEAEKHYTEIKELVRDYR